MCLSVTDTLNSGIETHVVFYRTEDFFFFLKQGSPIAIALDLENAVPRPRPSPSITGTLIMNAILCADGSVTNIDALHHWCPVLAVSGTTGLSQLTVVM